MLKEQLSKILSAKKTNLFIISLSIILATSCNDERNNIVKPEPKPPSMPSGFQDSVRIVAFCPNPEGNDDRKEWFNITNFGNKINLKGWYISDNEGVRWSLNTITLNRLDTIRIISDKSAQLLNSGDIISLYNNSTLIQRVSYGANVKEGEVIVPR